MPKRSLLVILLIIGGVIVAGVTLTLRRNATVEMGREPAFAPAVVPTQSLTPIATRQITDPTADWKVYTNEEYGFQIKYPQDWSVDEATDYVGSQKLIVFGGPYHGILTGDAEVIISFPLNLNGAINAMGSQFNKREFIKKEIMVNGVNALLVTASSPELSHWMSSRIFIEGKKSFIEINGDLKVRVFQYMIDTFTLL